MSARKKRNPSPKTFREPDRHDSDPAGSDSAELRFAVLSEMKRASSPKIDFRVLRIGFYVVFTLYSLVFLGWANGDFLFVVNEYDLFLTSRSFLVAHLSFAGGPLQYVASFLVQTFSIPLLGAVVVTALLLAVQLLSVRLFRLDAPVFVLSFLPSFYLLHILTGIGYLLFTEIQQDYLCGSLLGILCAFLFAMGFAGFARPGIRLLFSCFGFVLLFYATGIYALLGMLLCLFQEFLFSPENNMPDSRVAATARRSRTLRQGIMLFCALFVPLLFDRFGMTNVPPIRLYLIGIPNLVGGIVDRLCLPQLGLFSVVILPALFQVLRSSLFSSRPTIQSESGAGHKVPFLNAAVNLLLFLSGLYATSYFSHSHGDFPTVVKLCRLLEKEDWEGILSIPANTSLPVRPIVLIRNLALFKLGVLGSDAFRFSQITAQDQLLSKITSKNMFGNKILLEYGLINEAYRTSFNQYFIKKANANNLKMLALCSLVDRQENLAKKYLFLLKQSPLHRSWAERYTNYIEFLQSKEEPETKTESIRQVEMELDRIRSLKPVKDSFFKELSLDRLLMDAITARKDESLSSPLLDLFFFELLLAKDGDEFQKQFEKYFRENKEWRVPFHYQEALLLWGGDKSKTAENYKIEPQIVKKFEMFCKYQKEAASSGKSPGLDENLFRMFGDTYWYYHAVANPNAVY